MQYDADLLAMELLRVLRGSRSQIAFSRRLGYRSNVAYTWESGRRFPAVDAFFHAVSRVGGDPAAALARFAPVKIASATTHGLSRYLDGLRGTASVSEVARRMGRSRSAVARWLAGDASPRLPELLCLVDALTARVLDFLAVFADPAGMPSVAVAWARLQASREMARASPWATAVLLALELVDYRALPEHAPGWIARRIGISEAIESTCLDTLAAAGQIRRHQKKWAVVEATTLNVRAPGEGTPTSLRDFWAGVARERIAGGAPGVLGWNLGVASREDLARIEDVQRRAFREIRGIIAASAPGERLVLLSWGLVELDWARLPPLPPPAT
jgi:transcriptional regulator with XRE-family HTH domain